MGLCWRVGRINFPLIGVDNVNFSPQYDSICKGDGERDVLLFVPSNNGSCAKEPVDMTGNGIDGVLITETP